MKYVLPTIAVIIVFIIAGCGSAAFFETPNDLRNIPGKLYLVNGDSITGKLAVNTRNSLGSEVKITVEGEKKPHKYTLGEVRAYTIDGEYYPLKTIKGELSFSRNRSFMKRLTPADSRIHLYENMEQVTTNNNKGGLNTNRYEVQYYLQFPSDKNEGVWAVNSSRLVPNFDEKMSKIVADCPSLSEKIARKEPGYFYAQVSLLREKRAAVLLAIIEEYNRCK